MRFPIVAAAASLLLFPLASRADLTGDTVHVTFDQPNQTTVVEDDGNVVVPGFTTSMMGEFTIVLGGSNITILDAGVDQFPSVPFSGFVFTDTTGNPMITGATEDVLLSTLPGVTSTVTSNSVALNFAGLTMTSGEEAVFDLSFASPAATPEPSSFALLGTGLVGVAGALRRRLVRA